MRQVHSLDFTSQEFEIKPNVSTTIPSSSVAIRNRGDVCLSTLWRVEIVGNQWEWCTTCTHCPTWRYTYVAIGIYNYYVFSVKCGHSLLPYTRYSSLHNYYELPHYLANVSLALLNTWIGGESSTSKSFLYLVSLALHLASGFVYVCKYVCLTAHSLMPGGTHFFRATVCMHVWAIYMALHSDKMCHML